MENSFRKISLSFSLSRFEDFVRISNRIVEKRSDDILDWTDLSIIPSKQDFLLLEIIILDKQWISTRIKKYRVFFTYDFVPWFYIQDWGNILFLVPPSFLRNTIQGTGESKRCFDSTTREHRFPSSRNSNEENRIFEKSTYLRSIEPMLERVDEKSHSP